MKEKNMDRIIIQNMNLAWVFLRWNTKTFLYAEVLTDTTCPKTYKGLLKEKLEIHSPHMEI